MILEKSQIVTLIKKKLGATEDQSSKILDYLIFYIQESLDIIDDPEETMLVIIKQAFEHNEELIDTAVEFFNQANERKIDKAMTVFA